MIYALTFFSLTTLILFLVNTHPLILCINLVLISCIVSMLMMTFLSKWLALAIVLIFLGGMMVMFFYATSLSNNDKLLFLGLQNIIILVLVIFTLNASLKFSVWVPSASQFMSSLYNENSLSMVYILMAYLLLCLFFIVKMTSNFEGSLIKSF